MKISDKLLDYFSLDMAEIVVVEKLLIPPGVYDVSKETLICDLMKFLDFSENDLLERLRSALELGKDLYVSSIDNVVPPDVILCIDDIPDQYDSMPSESFVFMRDIDLKTFIKVASQKKSRILVVGGSIKKNMSTLIAYMHTFRFLHQISTYAVETDRELFESSFVRYTWDKSDLSQEEVDQYIVLSAEVVIASNIQRRVERLQTLLDQNAEDTEGRRMAMSLVEAINTAQTEYNQCVNRQTKLLNELKEKRSQRLSKVLQESASILNLVELWKDEESRNKMIKIAEIRKKNISSEIERLSSMEDIKSRIMGISEEEVLNG